MTPKFTAIANDPDGDVVKVTWRAYACHGSACDAVEFDSGADTTFEPKLPRTDASGSAYDTLEIRLEGRDSLGATARPGQTLPINLEDGDPSLELRADPRFAYVVGIPIGIYAKVGDVDDGPFVVSSTPGTEGQPDGAKLEWTAFAPPSGTAMDRISDHALPPVDPDSNFLQFAKTFTPNVIGNWDLQVIVRDPQDTPATPHFVEKHLPIHVDADHPPCLSQWDPAATSAPGTTLPISDPTLFQILVVSDDLDAFPGVTHDPIFGTTEFHWSIVPPGGTRQQLPAITGAGVALDPASYRPGDLVELRVEIQDRTHTPVNCPDGDLTCSVISDPTCIQRLTWRAEMR
jgi:hypothetical protein